MSSTNYFYIKNNVGDENTFSIKINNNVNLEYSTDGSTFTPITNNCLIKFTNYLYLKGNNNTSLDGCEIECTKQHSIGGYLISLLNGDNSTISNNTIPENSINTFKYLFAGDKNLTDIKDLIFPTNTVEGCYQHMFTGCKSLKSITELPATDLTDYCYHGMFMACKGLTKIELPESFLAPYAYSNMFLGSHNLKDVVVVYNENINETNYKGWLNNVSSNGEFKYKNGDDNINISTLRNQYHIPSSWDVLKFENVIVSPSVDNVELGADFLVYDTQDSKYKILKGETYNATTFNTARYKTNFDIIIDIDDTTLRAVAHDDAYGYANMINSDFAAANNYYRIEIDNKQAGSFTTKIQNTTYNVSWEAGATMDSIKSQINNSNVVLLKDGTGLGVSLTSSNTCTVTDITGTVKLIDMSTLAVYDKGVKYGDSYNPELSVIDNKTKQWQWVSVQTIMGSDIIPIKANSIHPMDNNGVNSYAGVNYKQYRSYISKSGNNTFKSDGVNGSAQQSTNQNLMKLTVFNNNVNSNAALDSDGYKMYEYYNNLFNSIGDEFAEKHDLYVSRYGEMEDLYAAYLMSHMVNTDNPTSGIVYSSKGYGVTLTNVKGKIMTLDYDYKYYPAYPPEYNALQYGLEDEATGFGKGTYYHPEPYDLALMFRDDIMTKLNNNFIAGNSKVTKLSNGSNKGSCAEYLSFSTWYYYGTHGYLNASTRNYDTFRSRPLVALPLN